MRKSIAIFLAVTVLASILSSCTLFSGALDKKNGLSKYLESTETDIRNENWPGALSDQDNAFKSWRKIKPFMQIDIDHDYVNLIEEYFIELKAYIQTQNKSEALAVIMLIKDTWDNIGIM